MTNAFEIRRASPASPPKKWLWRLAADRVGGVSPPGLCPQVDDSPPQTYSRSVGVSPTLLPLTKTPQIEIS
jgi:hypothetical protein